MVSKQKDKNLVRVRCLQNTIYGEAGDVGYVPESMVEAWVARGRVEYIVEPKAKKTRSKKEIKTETPVLEEDPAVEDVDADKNNEEG